MSRAGAGRRALQPLWSLTTGSVMGALVALHISRTPPPTFSWILIVVGSAATAAGFSGRRWWWLWLVAGLGLVGGRGLSAAGQDLEMRRLAASGPETALRIEFRVLSGWEPTRWGWRTTIRIRSAIVGERSFPFTGRQRFEVRRVATPLKLPAPGSVVQTLASLRGDPESPLLVAASPGTLDIVRPADGPAAVRDRLARFLLDAAGTNVRRIRSAELAAALALGRRDLLPRERRDGWRRSGLAHLLAVSGLHVGLVAGMLWLGLAATGIHPRTARWAMLGILPVYTMLAGAAPSAIRATLMAMVFLIGRQLGRGVLPMASILLVTSVLLMVQPRLVNHAGFQLTVLVTAALVRWVPEAAETLPLPGWIAGAAAVPAVAQLAASPIVATHFRTAIPGAVMSNLAVPLVLGPTLASALLATVLAPIWPTLAGRVLDITGHLESVLWFFGRPGRMWEIVVPTPPSLALSLFVVSGWLALQHERRARLGAAAWVLILSCLIVWWMMRPDAISPRVELLPVADGLAVTVSTSSGTVLMDGGRWQREAAEYLADGPTRRLDAVILSHADEDHTGGIPLILRSTPVGRVVLPRWMTADPKAVPLLRCARRRRVPVTRVVSGQVMEVGRARLEIIWPPLRGAPPRENERSLVARLQFPEGSVLLTSDIGTTTERRLVRSGALSATVLVVPHHGSRHSASEVFLDAVSPQIALIPAGPLNRYDHPHSEAITRLVARAIPHRYPKRDGRCGALHVDGVWGIYPKEISLRQAKNP